MAVGRLSRDNLTLRTDLVLLFFALSMIFIDELSMQCQKEQNIITLPSWSSDNSKVGRISHRQSPSDDERAMERTEDGDWVDGYCNWGKRGEDILSTVCWLAIAQLIALLLPPPSLPSPSLRVMLLILFSFGRGKGKEGSSPPFSQHPLLSPLEWSDRVLSAHKTIWSLHKPEQIGTPPSIQNGKGILIGHHCLGDITAERPCADSGQTCTVICAA